ncbi:uncharacterized protein ColSpa_00209 [Colletotrichum spaethianum]|uniref:Uncharacterized protein n=1 Tax=Colletotrichum spaethianum TaxID=700344 RepID=A0AA37NXG0_9PEZI|nr:uncharacterized protein ColSpa_00209 [Colletotrichum spaethianum]GKT40028.1 hypothetical protein ColSpa_00209 [Colletotrichum spaethianum]
MWTTARSWSDAFGWTTRVPWENWSLMTEEERTDRSVYGSLLQVLFHPREDRSDAILDEPPVE